MNEKIMQIANSFDIDKATKVFEFGNGLINDTYLVECNKNKYILQKLHSIFRPTVLVDTANITRHLSDNGLKTPLVVRTKGGKLFFKDSKNR